MERFESNFFKANRLPPVVWAHKGFAQTQKWQVKTTSSPFIYIQSHRIICAAEWSKYKVNDVINTIPLGSGGICVVSHHFGLSEWSLLLSDTYSDIKVTGVNYWCRRPRERAREREGEAVHRLKIPGTETSSLRASNLGARFDPDLNFTSEKSPKLPFILSGVKPDTERQLLLSPAEYCNSFSSGKL